MRVVIHGGMHKTATSSIQVLFHECRDILREHGIAYSDLGIPHHGPVLNVKNPNWDPRACGRLLAEARVAGAELLLLSSESVATLADADFRKIEACFPDVDLTFVFCVRHWNSFLPSRWSQNCRRRDSQSFHQFVSTVSAPASGHCDVWFDQIFTRAAAQGSHVLGVSYQNAIANGSGVVPAVLQACGLSNPLIARLVPQAVVRNRRIDWVTSELARLLNGAAADRLNVPQDDFCAAVGRFEQSRISFHFAARLGELDDDLRQTLRLAVEQKRTDFEFTGFSTLDDAYRKLLDQHGHRFTNLTAGDIFPDPVPSVVTAADIDWVAFRRDNTGAVDTAVTQLLRNGLSENPQNRRARERLRREAGG